MVGRGIWRVGSRIGVALQKINVFFAVFWPPSVLAKGAFFSAAPSAFFAALGRRFGSLWLKIDLPIIYSDSDLLYGGRATKNIGMGIENGFAGTYPPCF